MLTKHCSEPYLSQLISGDKTVEGRVNKGDWASLSINQNICLYDGTKSAIFKVIGMCQVSDFEQLYELFGHKLLPKVNSAKHAAQTYAIWFNDELIKEYGVVGVQLEFVRLN